jgi:hypothetical protein
MVLYRIVIGTTLFPVLCLKAKQGTFATPIGKARQICSANWKFLQIFFIRCTLPIGGEQIVGPIVLALHNRNEIIGVALKTIRSALPIVIEIAY